MFRIYRELKKGEFVVVGGDCAQGGEDSNVHQYVSKTYLDVPIVFDRLGVASDMTPFLHRGLEKVYDITGVKPTVALERQMGGASEMGRLKTLNRNDKYTLFVMPTIGKTDEKETTKLGYDMSEFMRPTALGDEKNIIDVNGIKIYDKETIRQLFWFIIAKTGKPQAMNGKHDDHVISLAVAIQLLQLCEKPMSEAELQNVISQLPVEKLFDEQGNY